MEIDTLDRPKVPARDTPPARRVGSIVLARHGEPALSRRVKLDAAGYRRWWAAYEEGGLLEGQVPPELLKRFAREAEAIFSSTLKRSIETAQAVVDGKTFASLPLFVEAPLPPPGFPRFFRLSPRWWGVVARAWWWFFDHSEGQETRDQAKVRARQAAVDLARRAEAGQDVLVLAHGFFNGMIGVELNRLGWRCVRDEGFKYWSARRFERR